MKMMGIKFIFQIIYLCKVQILSFCKILKEVNVKIERTIFDFDFYYII